MRLLSKPRDIQYVLWRSQIQSQFARNSQKLVAICGRTILFVWLMADACDTMVPVGPVLAGTSYCTLYEIFRVR